MNRILILALGWLVLSCSVQAAAPSQAAYDRFFAALHQVESGGAKDGQATIGDSGKAIGPLQVHRCYWSDSRVAGSYSRCNELGYSRTVAEGYLKRYAAGAWAAGDWESLSRCHNAGPNWKNKKAATQGYWSKVKKEMGL